ncbi:MAG: fumarylacetoacetate hydrolase family protein [Litorilituus sp.]|jgi:2-keto-4-pentenoate hydratase/2-oxohepta-3-ene-1,7-dioic acid hydratase in catechol pathway|nr:fumarylacetoacetate hydrolase family protein [Litorilituus sp.]
MQTVNFNNTTITPSKIICIGRNYVDHITELGNEIPDEMVVFFKANSSISTLLHASHQEPLHYEAELCFLYNQGKFCAVALGLDLTKRALQAKLKAKGLPWERAKAFDGAAVFSDFVAIDTIDDSLSLQLSINDEVVQAGGVGLMMYKPDVILSQLHEFTTLEDGDIVMTGTPKGVGEVIAGSKFSGKVFSLNEALVSVTWNAK